MPNTVPNYHLQNITFLGSFPDVDKAPKTDLPEFAFIGRSNVGKSSLINYLCHRKNLAKTSSTPGKTQLINLFNVEDKWMLADLPGYGYAKISKKMREKWGKMIENYLISRADLCCVFVLIDIRIPPQEIDIDMVNWLGEHQIPFLLIFTKADKVKRAEMNTNLIAFFNRLREHWAELPEYLVSSSNKDLGRHEILEFIYNTISH